MADTSKENTNTPQEARWDDLNSFYSSGGALKLWDDKEAWRLRAVEEGSFYQELLTKHGVRTILDTAAASGFHSVRLVQAGFSVVAVDGLRDFVDAGINNQKELKITFPFRHVRWNELKAQILPESPFDCALCLGGSLHHTDMKGISELFSNTRKLLSEGGIFVVEQRNYERLFSERPSVATHPCGWTYTLEYHDPHTIYFHLKDPKRGINVRFEGLITIEKELLPISQANGFTLVSSHFDHGRKQNREEASWIEYVFKAV